MAACAPSFSSCDVVPQQCYRRTAEESPAVSAPLSTRTTFSTDFHQKKKERKYSCSQSCELPGKNEKSLWKRRVPYVEFRSVAQCSEAIYRSSGSFDLFPAPYKSVDAPQMDRKVRPTVKQGRNQTGLAGHEFSPFLVFFPLNIVISENFKIIIIKKIK